MPRDIHGGFGLGMRHKRKNEGRNTSTQPVGPPELGPLHLATKRRVHTSAAGQGAGSVSRPVSGPRGKRCFSPLVDLRAGVRSNSQCNNKYYWKSNLEFAVGTMTASILKKGMEASIHNCIRRATGLVPTQDGSRLDVHFREQPFQVQKRSPDLASSSK